MAPAFAAATGEPLSATTPRLESARSMRQRTQPGKPGRTWRWSLTTLICTGPARRASARVWMRWLGASATRPSKRISPEATSSTRADPSLGSGIRINVFIPEAAAVHEILAHLGEPTSPPPRMAAARGPPLWEISNAEQGQFDPQGLPAPDYEFDQRIAWSLW